MTFVGKVLVVLNLVMGICLMAFAGAVFTVQTDWKKQTDEKDKQLKTEKDQKAQLETEYAALKDATNKQILELENRARQAEGQLANLNQNVKNLTDEKTNHLAERNAYLEQARIAKEEAQIRRTENLNLRKINKELHDRQTQLITEVTDLRDKEFELTRQIDTLNVRHKELLVEVSDKDRLLAFHQIDPTEAVDTVTPPPPAGVNGLVKETTTNSQSGITYVTITLGSDDGLAIGHRLFVSRTEPRPKYLGEIEIVSIFPDRAVGKVVLASRNGTIEVEDKVTTSIK